MQKISFDNNKFYIKNSEGAYLALITFQDYPDDTIAIDHTFVDPALRGQKIALQLVESVVRYARENNLKIIPLCSYAVKVLNSDEKYHDILKK